MTKAYLIGLGSNRRHGVHGSPARVIAAAACTIVAAGPERIALSPTLRTPPLGPGGREFANAAMLIRTPLDPPALLVLLKRVERQFGRRAGRRWGARVLDCDILAMRPGHWPPGSRRAASGRLAVPHAALADRVFALAPAARIAPTWPHPHKGGTLRQLLARLMKPRPVDQTLPRS